MVLTLLAIAFLALLILSHELGHFCAAKILGIKVDEFGIGFPPRLFSKKIGETEYSLNLLPFGGFVRIHGMQAGEEPAVSPKTTREVVYTETTELVTDEGGETTWQEEQSTTVVETGIDDLSSRGFADQSLFRKALVILAGVVMNFFIGWLALSLMFSVGVTGGVVIGEIVPGGPADQAGFEVGDTIKGFDSVESFIAFEDQNLGQVVKINDKEVELRANPPENEGPLGISVTLSTVPQYPWGESVWLGLKTALRTVAVIFSTIGALLWGVLSGNLESLQVSLQVAGPVGVFNIMREAVQLGFPHLMQLLGFISINLTVLNILPLPALDGGKLCFLILQRIWGVKIFNSKVEMIVNIAGFALLFTLMVVVTIRDIMNLL